MSFAHSVLLTKILKVMFVYEDYVAEQNICWSLGSFSAITQKKKSCLFVEGTRVIEKDLIPAT